MAFDVHEGSTGAATLRWRGQALAAALAGWVLGTALQLQQGALWPAGRYLALAMAAGAVVVLALWHRSRRPVAGPMNP